MSYNLEVTVKDGTASVTTSGDVPEGVFIVAGHEDAEQRSLSVSRRDEHGRFAQVATSQHVKGA